MQGCKSVSMSKNKWQEANSERGVKENSVLGARPSRFAFTFVRVAREPPWCIPTANTSGTEGSAPVSAVTPPFPRTISLQVTFFAISFPAELPGLNVMDRNDMASVEQGALFFGAFE